MIIKTIEPLSEINLKRIEDATGIKPEFVSKENISDETVGCADVIITRDRDFKSEVLEKCHNLKFLFVVSAGVEKLPFDLLKEKNIVVANSGDLSAEAMAEHTIGVMLMFSAKLLLSINNQRKKFWQKYVMNDTLCDKNLLVVGAGKIGRCIASKAKVFNMNVIGVKKEPTELQNFDKVVATEKLSEYMSWADYVVCTLPLTNETEKIFDYDMFCKMNPDGVFVNISRGKLVDEKGIVKALEENVIKGAALDVFDVEPLPKESPLWNMENVIVTTHSSGRIENFIDKTIPVFIDSFESFIKNEKPKTAIDLDKKY